MVVAQQRKGSTMQDPTPRMDMSRGAPMGRSGRNLDPERAGAPGKTHLRRLRLDRGGYDSGGAYWGLGAPLWYWESPDSESGYLRSPNRAAAKAEVLVGCPDAVFYR